MQTITTDPALSCMKNYCKRANVAFNLINYIFIVLQTHGGMIQW